MSELSTSVMSEQDAHRITATDFVNEFMASACERAASLAAMSDAEMFHGLDQKTIQYLQARIADNPELKTPLRQAALLRKSQPGRQPRTESRYVYFIQAEQSGLIKIGSASDPRGRLSALQTGSPERLRLVGYAEGGEREERRLHRLFESHRSHGEWFYPVTEVIDYISAIGVAK